MKRIIILFLGIQIAFSCFAQEQRDSIVVKKTVPDKDPCEQIFAKYNHLVEENFVYKHRIDSLDQQVKIFQSKIRKGLDNSENLQKQLSNYKQDIERCSAELDNIKKKSSQLETEIRDRNIKLENIATNFIYIPYEDFSIQKVAIPAIESLSNKYSNEEIRIKADLLKHYKEDTKALLAFFKETYSEPKFNAPNEFQENLSAFERLELIRRYEKYEDYENTFIGKIIDEVRKSLRSLSEKGLIAGEKGPTFSRTITILDDCIKTIQD